MSQATYTNGSRINPVRCIDYSLACDVAVERDRPTYCAVQEGDMSWTLVLVFPSRCYEVLEQSWSVRPGNPQA